MLNPTAKRLLRFLPAPAVTRAARQYVAGPSQRDARTTAEGVMADGFHAELRYLGSPLHEEPDQSVDAYCDLTTALAGWTGTVNPSISLAIEAFGYAADAEACEQRVSWVVDRAVENGVFVRLDMGDATIVDATLRFYRSLRAKHPGRVGCTLQAKLFRTRSDVGMLLGQRDHDVRLCKGALPASSDIAWQERQGIRENFVVLARRLWMAKVRTRLATHDPWLYQRLLELAGELELRAADVELQSHLGIPVKRTLMRLLANGHPVRVYVPYGPGWLPYGRRLLADAPDIVQRLRKHRR